MKENNMKKMRKHILKDLGKTKARIECQYKKWDFHSGIFTREF